MFINDYKVKVVVECNDCDETGECLMPVNVSGQIIPADASPKDWKRVQRITATGYYHDALVCPKHSA